MPHNDLSSSNLGLTRRIAGFWMVILSLGLAVVGLLVGVQQASSLQANLLARTEANASHLAERIHDDFDQRLRIALHIEAQRLRYIPETGRLPIGFRPAEIPDWMTAVYLWDGQVLTGLVEPEREMRDFVQWATAQLRARPLQPSTDKNPPRPEVIAVELGEEPMALAIRSSVTVKGRPALLAAAIDLSLVRSGLIEPQITPNSGLELVAAGSVDSPWTQLLYESLSAWALIPTKTHLQEVRRLAWGQAAASLGLVAMAMVTLLIATGVLLRVLRREIALGELKANFVADVSHELKTPLALIRLFGETLQSGRVASEQKRQEYYEIITRESARLTTLIENILDFSRVSAGRSVYRLESDDVGAVVRDTYEAYRAQLDHHGFEHRLTLAPDLPPVSLDRNALAQALINLITNAIKYSGDDKSLVIEVAHDTRRNQRGVLLSFHDQGIGIRPEDRARVFEGFFRSSDRRVREQGGAGLGLGLVKHIVDAHGGSLDVESRLVKGTTFRIFLPAMDEGSLEDSGGLQPISPKAVDQAG